MLLQHEWKGNVRELENLIERVVAFSTGPVITEEEIQGWLNRPTLSASTAQPMASGVPADLPAEGLDLEDLMSSIEKELLLKALERSKWVKKKAARLLHLKTRSFRYRLEKHAIRGGRD